MEGMKDEIKKLLKLFHELGDEVTWSRDKVLQKDSQIKALKDKFSKLEIAYEKLSNRVQPERKAKVKTENVIEDETLIPIQPKPLLFGQDVNWG